jgi:hypothetical protein
MVTGMNLLFICILVVSFLSSGALSNVIEGRPRYSTVFRGDSTEISGYILENTTVTLDGSPYIVVGDVVVVSDVFLTIEPGVVVRFTAGTNLVVDGGLIAQGNSTHKIAFTSNSTTPTRGDWGTINIRDYSTAANRIDHVQIEYASTALTLAADCNITNSALENNSNGISLQNPGNAYVGHVQIASNTGSGISGSIDGSIEIENSNISLNGAGISVGSAWDPLQSYMRNCIVAGNTGGGVSVMHLTMEINNLTILANGGGGIGFDGGEGVGILGRIYNSNVSDNGGTGLTGRGWLDVQNCTFQNNTNGLVYAASHEHPTGYLTNCTIRGNREHGISIHDVGLSATSYVQVNRSSITHNGGDGINTAGGIGPSISKEVGIYDSVISENTNGIVLDERAGAYVSDSTIRSNSECGVRFLGHASVHLYRSVVEHNLYGCGDPVGVYGGVDASDSVIRNNTIGVLAIENFQGSFTTVANNSLVNIQIWREGQLSGGCNLESCNVYNSLMGIQMTSGTIRHCNIFNHTEYNIESKAAIGSDINATYNWWGTANEASIAELIYDYYDDHTLGRVLYEPYLTQPYVQRLGTTISFTLSPNPVDQGQLITGTGNLTESDSGKPIANAQVDVYVDQVFLISLTTNSTGWFKGADYAWTLGSREVNVTYPGNATYNPSNHTETFTVQIPSKVDTQVAFTLSPNPAGPGATITLSGTLKDTTNKPVYPAQVKVEYSTNGGATWSPIWTLTTNSAGAFSITFTAPGVGTYLARVSYAGSSIYNPSSYAQTLTVQTGGKLNTQISFTLSPNPASPGATVTLSGTLKDANLNSIYPAQVKVEYSTNGGATWNHIFTLNTNAAGQFSVSFGAPGPGTYLARISYAGSTNYNPSSRTETLTVS